MQLTGIEVPVEPQDQLESNTVLVVISDDRGPVRVVKVDPPFHSYKRIFFTRDRQCSGKWRAATRRLLGARQWQLGIDGSLSILK